MTKTTVDAPLLSMQNISKRFGATQALDDVSIEARAGEVLALIGENGAGKSTLMRVLGGADYPDSGHIELDGERLTSIDPQSARDAGVAVVYQELNLAPDLSIEDNIMLGMESSVGGWLNRRKQRELISEALELLGHSNLNTKQIVGTLSMGLQQLVEIARGLVSNARVIVFDEPTSSLERSDVRRLFNAIKRLQDRGIAIVYISHFLEEIREIATRYCVLRDGKLAGMGELTDATNQDIVSLMVGRDVETLFPKVEHEIGDVVLTCENLTGFTAPKNVSLNVRRGEILGLFGMIGAGRTETIRYLFGLDRETSGTVKLKGNRLTGSPHRRIKAGLGFVSEDRKGEGLAQEMSIEDNLTLSDLSPYATGGVLNLDSRRSAATDWMQRLEVKARAPSQPISSLSGGNQQKVAIARVMHQGAEVLLLDEPTRGIDVATKAAIYRLIGELAAEGKSIVFVSSYLPELMAICDTIGVMAGGQLIAVDARENWTETEILKHAIGSS